MADIFNKGRMSWGLFFYFFLICYLAYRMARNAFTSPLAVATQWEVATGIFLNILWVGILLMGAFFFLYQRVRKKIGLL